MKKAEDDMTLRDYFAAAALPGVIVEAKNGARVVAKREQRDIGEDEILPRVAETAYAIADAMLAERVK